MKSIGQLLIERETARILETARPEEPAPQTPARPAAIIDEAAQKTCREDGRKLFAAFQEQQRRIIEAEIVAGNGGRNAEERSRLRATVRALQAWVTEARELGIASEFQKDIKLFTAYLHHEAKEQALANKVEIPLLTSLFLEGADVAAPVKKRAEPLDYDPERCIHY
jgi:hypothetical protein